MVNLLVTHIGIKEGGIVKIRISKEKLEYELNEMFLTYNEISEKYNLSNHIIRKHVKHYGIKRLKFWEFLNKKTWR